MNKKMNNEDIALSNKVGSINICANAYNRDDIGYNVLDDIDFNLLRKILYEYKTKQELNDIETWVKSCIFENGEYATINTKSAVNLAKFMFLIGKSGKSIREVKHGSR